MKRLISGPWHGLRTFALLDGVVVLFFSGAALTNPALAFALGALGASLTLSQLGGPVRRLSPVLATLAAVVGAVILAAGGSRGAGPSASAVLLLLLVAGQLCPESAGWRHLKTASAMAAVLGAWTVLNGYLFGVAAPREMSLGPVAVPTAVALFFVALGVLATQPGTWPTSIIFANGMGGVMSRWLLPAATLAPPLLGWILGDFATARDPDIVLRWAVYSVCSSAGSVGLILVLAHRIELLDAERTAATLMSRHDPLTDLPNRRAFDAFLLESFNLARRHGRPLALLTIDVDEFKTYNDTYGHPAGDDALKAVAHGLTEVVRETDLAARIGGEEFAIVLPETDLGGARSLAERVRSRVSSEELLRRVTVSVGLATLSADTPTAAALLRQSDAALYEAKRAGRDRVSLSGKAFPRRVV